MTSKIYRYRDLDIFLPFLFVAFVLLIEIAAVKKESGEIDAERYPLRLRGGMSASVGAFADTNSILPNGTG